MTNSEFRGGANALVYINEGNITRENECFNEFVSGFGLTLKSIEEADLNSGNLPRLIDRIELFTDDELELIEKKAFRRSSVLIERSQQIDPDLPVYDHLIWSFLGDNLFGWKVWEMEPSPDNPNLKMVCIRTGNNDYALALLTLEELKVVADGLELDLYAKNPPVTVD